MPKIPGIEELIGGLQPTRRNFLQGAGALSPLPASNTRGTSSPTSLMNSLRALHAYESQHSLDPGGSGFEIENDLDILRTDPAEFATRYVSGYDRVLQGYLSLSRSLPLPPQIAAVIEKGGTTHQVMDYLTNTLGPDDWDIRRSIAQGEDWLGDEALSPERVAEIDKLVNTRLDQVLKAITRDMADELPLDVDESVDTFRLLEDAPSTQGLQRTKALQMILRLLEDEPARPRRRADLYEMEQSPEIPSLLRDF